MKDSNITSITKRSIYLLFFILITYSYTATAQSEITITNFLKSIKESNQVKMDSNTVTLLKDYNYNLPIIKNVQFRTETSDLILDRQEYTLRVKPNSLRAISNQKKTYQNKIEEIIIKNQLKFNEELKRRYLLLVDYYFTDKLIELNTEKHIQITDKLQVLSQSIFEINFDVKDLIEAEDELIETNLKLINLKESRINQLSLIKQALNIQSDSVKIIFNDLITPVEIIDKPIQDSISNEQLNITLQKLKLYVLENEMELTAAKSKQILEYVQARYGGKKNDLFDENFSLGFGINLPFFGDTRSRKGDYYIKILNEESKLASLTEKNDVMEKQVFKEFNEAKTNYQILKKQIDESSVLLILEAYKKMEGIPPLQLLRLKNLQNKKRIAVLKSEHLLYKSYINTLANLEILFQIPLRNYLSSSKELIDP